MLQQLLEVWAVEHGQAYDVFEVAPEISSAERDALAKELQRYSYVVSTMPWKGAMVVGAGTEGRSVDPATAKEVQHGYELELSRRDWLR
jgi:hypothetical protein